ncbi:hypothetical protein [Prolixibacter sp. SD074]|jgi:hypothetical protein|uniref:hypothetical protein n=1 Tax=Prolixibacter sp. SD074 TaxID=2652391 RepID=UPI001272A092|nr:hypothetical protein [Prolixibacter sp. SD074]GET29144.1 hypothetical protein SD074_13460 [Prolixibacter sp. SD074]
MNNKIQIYFKRLHAEEAERLQTLGVRTEQVRYGELLKLLHRLGLSINKRIVDMVKSSGPFFFTVAAAGDFLMVHLFRKENRESWIQGHSSEIGFGRGLG